MRNLALLVSLLFSSVVIAGGPLEVGDEIPAFTGIDENGSVWNFPDGMKTDYLVLYFYPAAFTGGCTKQACSYRDNMEALKKEGIQVIGVSGDDHSNLASFKKFHQLNFTLLSDSKGEMAELFGVPVRDGGSIQRTIDGEEKDLQRYLTTSRWTMIVGPDRKLIYKNSSVNATEDSQQVLEFIVGQK